MTATWPPIQYVKCLNIKFRQGPHIPPPPPAAKKASFINGIGTHLLTRHDTLLVVIIIN